jgi:hypothetical protein
MGGHLARIAQAGAVPRRELDAWSSGLAAAHAAGHFLAGFTAFIVAGTRAG